MSSSADTSEIGLGAGHPIREAAGATLERDGVKSGVSARPPVASWLAGNGASPWNRSGIEMDPRRGFEPRFTDSESVVLPLDDRGSRRARFVPERGPVLKALPRDGRIAIRRGVAWRVASDSARSARRPLHAPRENECRVGPGGVARRSRAPVPPRRPRLESRARARVAPTRPSDPGTLRSVGVPDAAESA